MTTLIRFNKGERLFGFNEIARFKYTCVQPENEAGYIMYPRNEEERRVAKRILENFDKIFDDELDMFADEIASLEGNEQISLLGVKYMGNDIDGFKKDFVNHYSKDPLSLYDFLERMHTSTEKDPTDRTYYMYCLVSDYKGIPLDILRKYAATEHAQVAYGIADPSLHF